MRSKLCEMKFEEFLALYMPAGDHDLPESGLAIPAMDGTTLLGSKEGPICDELCEVAQAIFAGCLHGEQKLVAKNTRNHSDPSDKNDAAEMLRVDLSFYPDHDDAKSDYELPKPRKRAEARPQVKDQASTRWAWISLAIEVKTDHAHCAFVFDNKTPTKQDGESKGAAPQQHANDAPASQHKKADKANATPKSFVRSGPGADGGLGQQAEYVAKLFRRQPRLYCFTMLVFKGQARVVRWDRAGAIVSTPIDFEKDPSLFHRVIWRYACMTEAQRGFDPTVRRATKEEVKQMRDCRPPNEWADKSRNAALDQDGWPAYTITMPVSHHVDQTHLQPIAPRSPREDASVNKEAYANSSGAKFVVGKRYFASSSPTGRGTKCYIAYEVARDRLVFLKDYWRADTKSSLQEGQVLEDLRKAGVQFVPTPLFRGHVRSGNDEQETCTQAFLPENPRLHIKPAAMKHYRLVVKEIGRPLEEHENALYLVGALLDALQAHQQAWVQVKIMHRDMSPRNILLFAYIDEEGTVFHIGVLIDWDLCKHEDYLGTAMNVGRSGTWPFMSAGLLRNPTKRHEVADDLESVVHILGWTCLRLYEHSMSDRPDSLRMHILGMYDAQDIVNGETVGGDQKHRFLLLGNLGVDLVPSLAGTPLAKLLSDLGKICKEHYLAVPKLPKAKTANAIATQESANDEKAMDTLQSRYASFAKSLPPPRSVGEAPAQHILVASRNSTSPPPSPLNTHDAIINAFVEAVLSERELWKPLKKTPDQFAAFKNTTIAQCSIERSSQQSSGSKRTLEVEPEELAKPGPSKRARAANTGGLESLPEEPAAEPVLHDGED
ncbi:uncharacterized protein B0H18DRAFT_49889 [Fomitopsis serialis]|uniref:uncharacterized protein n=1 Tax=Fomitopsis serialis TaxID=139415 RepID=UPI002008C293|nr:uncharacterized protein B0H18DRAFT_49889 [Neoantrodia serialis]KAH9932195.1 hypothetical protein B0H18DRAFT_49889 [Neoantrodia serialis]